MSQNNSIWSKIASWFWRITPPPRMKDENPVHISFASLAGESKETLLNQGSRVDLSTEITHTDTSHETMPSTSHYPPDSTLAVDAGVGVIYSELNQETILPVTTPQPHAPRIKFRFSPKAKPQTTPRRPHPFYDSLPTHSEDDDEAHKEVDMLNSQFKQNKYVPPTHSPEYSSSGEDSEERSSSPPRVDAKVDRDFRPRSATSSDSEDEYETSLMTPIPKSSHSCSQKLKKSKVQRSQLPMMIHSGLDSDLDGLGIPSHALQTVLSRKTMPKEKEPVKYDGKIDIHDYLLYYLNIVELNGWDYDTQGLQLSTSLTGDALDILSSLDHKENRDMHSLCKALIRKYAPPGRESQYSYKLLNRSLKANETAAEFGNALKKLVRKAYPKVGLPEELVVNLFKRGLTSDNMKMQIHLKNPDKMIDAIEIATAVETFEELKGLESGKKPKEDTVASVTSPPKPFKPQLKPVKPPPAPVPVTLEPVANISLQQTAGRNYRKSYYPDVECFFCKRKGHYRSSCDHWKAKRSRNAARDQANL